MNCARRLTRVAIPCALLLALPACAAQSAFDPAGPAADALRDLGWFVLITFLVTTGVMWVLIGWIATRRRGTLAHHAPADEGGGINWILIGGFGIPAAVLATIFVVTLGSMSAFPIDHHDPEPELEVVGRQWWFGVEYLIGGTHQRVKTTTEIHIPVGRPIDIALETRDVIHSFWVPQLHGKVDLVPGITNRIRIQADRPGIYRGECAEYCGAQHAHMMLYVIAEPQAQFDAWLAAQRLPAAAPTSPDALRGKEHFERMACSFCHTIKGTPALGTVGPDLTHLASRRTIAGGMLPNDTANLSAWITHAQSLKPGAQMPDMTQFTGEHLHEIVAYLQSLK
jgi:cytochrome c oxidase subunit II